ncbi:rhodanese-like domain-containing protein [Paenibacillus sp. P3E]|uniref:rhodanese-like domain-containing protein n=1 Tax=Paenibacillus sp. P3E TaxID=1349435 RepID=UPI00093D8ACE
MIITMLLVFLIIYRLIQHFRFLCGVTILSLKSSEIQVPDPIKLLDIRDVSDFDKGHVPESINISLGRLPFVWEKDLSPKDSVVILTGQYLKGKKATRILQKKGFRDLYLVVAPVSQLMDRVHKSHSEKTIVFPERRVINNECPRNYFRGRNRYFYSK